MSRTRTHVVIPTEVVSEIDELVGPRRRSRFLTELATKELRRLRLLRALEALGSSPPVWNPEDHPELTEGAAAWVRRLRDLDR